MLFSLIFLLLSGPQTSVTSTLINKANSFSKQGKMDVAATVYEAARILTPKSKVILSKLSSIYLATGRNGQALELLKMITKDYCGATCGNRCFTPPQCSNYKINVIRLKRENAESDRVPLAKSAPKLAKMVFSRAIKLKKKRKYEKAKNLLRACLKLNPDLPGVYRHLGEVYTKLKKVDQADSFYLWYLKVRPAGPNAAKVRKKLSKKALKTLGKVRLEASGKCKITIGSSILTNARGKVLTTPIKSITLPVGRYAIGFICQKQNLARRFYVNVKSGKTNKLKFKFGTISVRLKPWARILIASKSGARKGKYMDAGLFKLIGLPVGKYHIKLVSFNNRKKMERDVVIKDKKHLKIRRWKK
jgi:tetratricopeptide (TPR) repeat protein